MPNKKSKTKLTSKTIESNVEEKTTPRTAKIVLFVFGVGALILRIVYVLIYKKV